MKPGSIVQTDLKVYYRRQEFAYQEAKLSFEQWGNEGKGKADIEIPRHL